MEGGKRRNNSNDNDRKKKRKLYCKLQQRGAIEGKQGILFTCNVDQEDRCSREAITLLTEYAEKFYPETLNTEEDQPDVFDEDQNDLDIEAAIANEVKQLKSKQKDVRLFDSYELGAKGNFFVSINNDNINPVEFVRRIFEDIIEKKIPKTRFTSRMIPILGTCVAKDENIEPLAKKLIVPQFNNRELPPKKYSFVVNIRNNSGFGTKALIIKLNEFVDLANFVQLKNFDWAIVVEIVKTTCMISITQDYLRFKRYNIREIVKTFGTEHGNSTTSRVKQNDNNNPNNTNNSTKTEDVKEDSKEAPQEQQEEDNSKEQ